MKLEKLIPIISEKLRQEKGILAVLLYGSYAKGVAKKTSDIDIAILYDYECMPTPIELWDLKTQLDLALSSEVVLNLVRAIQLCVDIAAAIITEEKWGIPKTLAESFVIHKF